MHITLDIADDVLMAVKNRARRQKRSTGDLEALTHRYREDAEAKKAKSFYGFDPLPPRGGPVSNELIDKLREGDLGLL